MWDRTIKNTTYVVKLTCHYFNLMFMELCIARCVFYITKMQLTQYSLLL